MPPCTTQLRMSKCTLSLYLSFSSLMYPLPFTFTFLLSSVTTMSSKRMLLTSPLMRHFRLSGRVKLRSTGANTREMSFSCVRPVMVDVR